MGKRRDSYPKPFQSAWIAFALERIPSNLSLRGPIIALGAHFDSETHLPGRNQAFPARSASIGVRFQKGAGAIAASGLRKRESFKESPLQREMSVGIMMDFPPIVWPIGSVQVERVPGIRSLPTAPVQKMGLRILRFFITDAPLTVFSARTGRTEKGFGIERGSARKNWPRRLMAARAASVTLEGTPLHSCLTPLNHQKGPWRRQKEEFFESVGRRMAR